MINLPYLNYSLKLCLLVRLVSWMLHFFTDTLLKNKKRGLLKEFNYF